MHSKHPLLAIGLAVCFLTQTGFVLFDFKKQTAATNTKGLSKTFSFNTWGKLSKVLNKGLINTRKTVGPLIDKDGATAGELKAFSLLNQDSVDRSFGALGPKVTIRSGTLRDVQVPPSQFFKRYEKDLGLLLEKSGLILEEQKSASPLYESGLRRYHQFFKSGEGGFVPVAGSKAVLQTKSDFVNTFSHNFIPNLDRYIQSTKPVISLEQARSAAQLKMGYVSVLSPTNPELAQNATLAFDKQLKKLESIGSQTTFKSLTMDQGVSSPQIDSLQIHRIIDKAALDKVSLVADIKSPLIIGFSGPRKAQNARLAWRLSIGDESDPYFVAVDALSGALLKSWKASVELDESPENFLGENLPVTGIPWPYYGSTGEAVSLTGNKKGDAPYHLACKKNDEPATSQTYCPSSTYVFSEMSSPGMPTGVTSNTTFFGNTTKAEVSLYQALMSTQAYFENLINYKGYRGAGEDSITAVLGKKLTQGIPGAQATVNEGSEDKGIFLKFHGYPSELFGAPTGPFVSHDIVGHEYFHGIFHYQVDPEITEDMEISYINEGLADFLGESVELESGKGKVPWKIGDQIFGNNGQNNFLRNLSEPKKSSRPRPDTYQGYYYVKSSACKNSPFCFTNPNLETIACNDSNGPCDPTHTNSLVVSHAFQLMADGSTGFNDLKHQYHVPPIGRRNAALMAMLSVFELKPTDTIRDLREITVNIALNVAESKSPLLAPLKSVKETLVESVESAWFAVGVGDLKSDRFYSPSDKNHDNFDLAPANVTLASEVFPEKGENKWIVEVGTTPNLSNSFYQYLQQDDIPKDVSIQSAEKSAGDVVPDNEKHLIHASFQLKPKTVYYWHICTNPEEGPEGKKQCTEWHETQTFSTEAMDVEAISPADESLIAYSKGPLDFTWKPVKGVGKYILTFYERLPKGNLGKDLGIPAIVTQESNGIVMEHPLPNMAGNLNGYCWDVAPVLPNGKKEAASGINCYGVKMPAPKPISPLGTLEPTTGNLEFKWEAHPEALNYEIEVCGNTNNQADCNQGEHLKTSSLTANLSLAAVGDEDHCWRVKAMGPNGDWGDEGDFVCYRVQSSDVTLLSPVNGAEGIDKSSPFSWQLPQGTPTHTGTDGQPHSRCGFFYQPLPEGSAPPAASLHAAGSAYNLPGAWSFSTDSDAKGVCSLTGIVLEAGKQHTWQAFGLTLDGKTIHASSPVAVFRAKDMNPVIVSPSGSVSADTPQIAWQYDGGFGGGYAVAISTSGSTPLWGGAVPPNSDPTQGYVRIDTIGQKGVTWTNLQPDTKYEVSVFVLDKTFKQSSAYPMASQSFTTEKPHQCNTQQVAGGPQIDTKTFDLGKKTGTFSVDFCTFTAADRIIVSYENAPLWDSGCRSTGEKQPLDYADFNNCFWEGSPNIKYGGNSSLITVMVQPGCNPSVDNTGTEWGYMPHCPQ